MVINEVTRKIQGADTEHELIQALIDSVGILAKELDEQTHRLDTNIQYVDEHVEESGNA